MVRTKPPRPALRRFSATHFGHRFTQLRFSLGMNSRVQTEQDRQPFVRAHLEQNGQCASYVTVRRRYGVYTSTWWLVWRSRARVVGITSF